MDLLGSTRRSSQRFTYQLSRYGGRVALWSRGNARGQAVHDLPERFEQAVWPMLANRVLQFDLDALQGYVSLMARRM